MMKQVLLSAALLALFTTQPSFAGGSITRACMQSDRPKASRATCGCIQNVADRMLTRSERSKVKSLLNDPSKSQKIRQSDKRSDEKFWKKYKAYGQAAANICQ